MLMVNFTCNMFLTIWLLTCFELIPCPLWGRMALAATFAISYLIAMVCNSIDNDAKNKLAQEQARMSKEIELLKTELKELKDLTV